jgi:hypothetical protein
MLSRLAPRKMVQSIYRSTATGMRTADFCGRVRVPLTESSFIMKKLKQSTALVKSGRAPLLRDLRGIIAAARQTVARGVNTALVDLYWRIGMRIRSDILAHQRAGYGQQIVAAVGRQLETEFGRGFSEKSLHRMIQFAEAFQDEQIVAALRRQLSWTHSRILVTLKDPLQRDFYTEMCRLEGWSVRQLQEKIDGMLYERTALSKKPARLIRREIATLRAEGQLTPDLVFKDPYVLDFPRPSRYVFRKGPRDRIAA